MRPLEFNDLNNNISKLSRAFKESMRLHAVAGIGSGIIVPEGQRMNLGGYTLPPGTMIWVPFFATMCSSHNFTRAEEYWPERWEHHHHHHHQKTTLTKELQHEMKQEPLESQLQ